MPPRRGAGAHRRQPSTPRLDSTQHDLDNAIATPPLDRIAQIPLGNSSEETETEIINDEDELQGGEGEGEGDEEDDPDAPDSSFAFPPYLREVSSLASCTVSTSKPSCGSAALLNPSVLTFWQSDGPQPHFLTLTFFKLVEIVKVRIYLDFKLDESYTPVRMIFNAGFGEYDLEKWAEWSWTPPERGTDQDKVDGPRGWIDIPLDSVGGMEDSDFEDEESDEDGNVRANLMSGATVEEIRVLEEKFPSFGPAVGVLRCMCLQIQIVENYQNGKDTHLRGLQVFARDEKVQDPRERSRRRKLKEWDVLHDREVFDAEILEEGNNQGSVPPSGWKKSQASRLRDLNLDEGLRAFDSDLLDDPVLR